MLINVVLILTDTDRLRIQANQLSQRIHQSPSDAHGSPYRNIVIRKLLASHVAGGVNGGPAFINHHNGNLSRKLQGANEGLGFTPCGSIANCNRFNLMLLNQSFNRVGSVTDLTRRLARIDDIVVKKLPLSIEADNFASRPETGIDRHHILLTQRRSQKKFAKIVGKHANRFRIRAFFGFHANLSLHRETQ